MKERNRRGQFRATESHNYSYKKRMNSNFGQFDTEAEEAFNEAALDKYDFAAKGTGKPCGGSHIAANKTCKLGAGGGGGGSASSSKSGGGGSASASKSSGGGGAGGGGGDAAAEKDAKAKARNEKSIKKAKSELRMEANGLKQMRDMGIKDNRISQAEARVRSAKSKLESARDKEAKRTGSSRPEKSTMTSRQAKEERDIKRKASKGDEKSKAYVDLKKRINDGKVQDPISARRELSSLRGELKPGSSV